LLQIRFHHDCQAGGLERGELLGQVKAALERAHAVRWALRRASWRLPLAV